MKLRKGRLKSIVDSSMDAALLAVEVYNKPRTSFRSEAYISFMVIAWTRLFHAYFHSTIGDRYYYKDKSKRFVKVDGERKAWELSECIKKYTEFDVGVKENLQFFIKLRNKIEHRHVEHSEIDAHIFGECQALLYNYENMLIKWFGNECSINESLVYSLQFSSIRLDGQVNSSKELLSKDVQYIKKFVSSYRNSLSDEAFGALAFSVKLLQIPKVANSSRSDAAVEFVNWSSLSEEEKEEVNKICALVKDKRVFVEGVNLNCVKPGIVLKEVNSSNPPYDLTHPLHKTILTIFGVKPEIGSLDPFDTNTKYCLYDEAHKDYLYTPAWIGFLKQFLASGRYTKSGLKSVERRQERLEIDAFAL